MTINPVTGRKVKGPYPQAKIKDKEELDRMLRSGAFSHGHLAEVFGVSPQAIQQRAARIGISRAEHQAKRDSGGEQDVINFLKRNPELKLRDAAKLYGKYSVHGFIKKLRKAERRLGIKVSRKIGRPRK